MESNRQQTRAWRRSRATRLGLVFHLALLFTPLLALATPSQQDVFRSIQDSVKDTSEVTNTNYIPWLCVGAGIIIVLALFSKRQSRQATPRIVSHSGRLLKEILKRVPLRPRELKQLKTLAEEIEMPDGPPVSPLTLILCPSIIIKSVNEKSTRADRRTLVQVLRKMGIR